MPTYELETQKTLGFYIYLHSSLLWIRCDTKSNVHIILPVVWKASSTIPSSWSEAARWNTLKMFFHPDLILAAWELTIWATHRTTMSRIVGDLIHGTTKWHELFITTAYMVTVENDLLFNKPVFLHDMLKWPQEILLESEIGKLPFLQKFHGQLSQRVNSKERNVLVGITSNLTKQKGNQI